jgi:hypothetical protein
VVSVNERQATSLALICAEWDGAMTHLRILRQVGCRVPDEVMRRVLSEANDYTALWSALNDEWWTYEESVRQARQWLTGHQALANELSGRPMDG